MTQTVPTLQPVKPYTKSSAKRSARAWSYGPKRFVPKPHSRMSGFSRASFPSGKSRNSSAAASPWIPPTPGAPSTPEHAIRNRISHHMRDISSLMRDISSCTSRARASFTSRPRALGCTDVYGFGIAPADLGTAPPYGQRLPHPNFTAPQGDVATTALERHCPGLCALQAVTTMLLQAAGVLSPPLLHRPNQVG